MKRALVIVFSRLQHDARVRRQVHWLTKNYEVTVLCFDSDEIPGCRVVRVKQTKLTPLRKLLLATALTLRAYSLAYQLFHAYGYLIPELRRAEFDLIVGNDIDAVPLAFKIKGNSKGKVIFDAHEYAPRHFENNKIWKTFFQPFYIHLCNAYIPQVDGMLTVGEGLANEYEKNFGVKPVIITNATGYVNISPSSPGTTIKLVHHGIANPSRRLELMLEMMTFLDSRFTLDLILMTSDFASDRTKNYIETFKKNAQANPRIRVLPGVKSSQVVETINMYDIGVFLIPPVNFNYANTLPNKLFDFIQARLGIAIGPTPEMAAIVTKFGLGVVSDDFTPISLAKKLNALSVEDIKRFKSNASASARSVSAETNEVIFRNLLAQIHKS